MKSDKKKLRLKNINQKTKNKWKIKMNSSVIKTERSVDRAHFCVKCDKQIQDRYFLKALNAFWHENCLKCSCCDCRLADVGSTLFTRENVILCKSDYLRWENVNFHDGHWILKYFWKKEEKWRKKCIFNLKIKMLLLEKIFFCIIVGLNWKNNKIFFYDRVFIFKKKKYFHFNCE